MAEEPTDQKLEDMFKRAADVAAKVPEHLQEVAFNRALDALLSEGVPAQSSTLPDRKERLKNSDDEKINVVASLMSMSRDSAPEVDAEEGALGKALALLVVAEREVGANGLTAPQIAEVLTKKFKWKVSRQAVTQALDRVGRMVDSNPGDSGGRIYQVMSAGEKYLVTPSAERPSLLTSVAGRRPATRIGSGKPSGPDLGSSTGDSDGNSKKGGRKSTTGPAEALDFLMANGFFKTPRVLGDIKSELRDRRGLIFKSTDLSPRLTRLLRDGKLTRERNGDSQYEYTTD